MRTIINHCKFITFTLVTLYVGVASAQDNSSTEIETAMRAQLQQMFYAEQFVINVVESKEGTIQSYPGLYAENTATNSKVYVILDTSISTERALLAKEILTRISESFDSTIDFRQGPVLKKLPLDLIEEKKSLLPQPSQPQQPSSAPLPENNALAKDLLGGDDTKKVDKPEPPVPQLSLFELVKQSPDFAIKILAILWTAAASLIGIAALLRKSPPAAGTPSGNVNAVRSVDAQAAGLKGTDSKAANSDMKLKANPMELVKRQIMRDLKIEPERASKILTKWIGNSQEETRIAAIFGRNCDLQILESICSHMHAADVEAMSHVPLKDFDASHLDNETALHKMRSELVTLSAAGKSTNDKTSPLQFLWNVDAKLLSRILKDESAKTIAQVASQLPVHRVKDYFEELPSTVLSDVMGQLEAVKLDKETDFIELKNRLSSKIATLETSLFTDEEMIRTMVQIMKTVSLPEKQIDVAKRILSESAASFAAVRQEVFFATDLNFLPVRCVRMLAQQCDAQKLAAAVSFPNIDLTQMMGFLPENYKIMFEEARKEISTKERAAAWGDVQGLLAGYLEQGQLTKSEAAAAKSKSDAQLSAVRIDKNAA